MSEVKRFIRFVHGGTTAYGLLTKGSMKLVLSPDLLLSFTGSAKTS